jgi:hypothetical protein
LVFRRCAGKRVVAPTIGDPIQVYLYRCTTVGDRGNPAARPGAVYCSPEYHLGVGAARKDGCRGLAIDWFDVLKWILIVLAAGFIGQFGKRLADHLVARARDRRATTPHSPPPSRAGEKAAVKMAKKAAKAEVKGRKKTSL